MKTTEERERAAPGSRSSLYRLQCRWFDRQSSQSGNDGVPSNSDVLGANTNVRPRSSLAAQFENIARIKLD
jgi:hypothetical protein